jgi:cyclopropane fatty-acyl-phospholipid synthase-like methyltransferase
MTKQFSPACERNSAPILDVISPLLKNTASLLEIGSGTGQHAMYFGRALPHIRWQCSDRTMYHESIILWLAEANLSNVQAPIELEVGKSVWPECHFDAVFTANTCHIMAWEEVVMMFEGVTKILNPHGIVLIYGPFNYAGQFTSASNQNFDTSLKAQAPHMGIRDFEAIAKLADENGLCVSDDIAMPANNRLLLLKKCAHVE